MPQPEPILCAVFLIAAFVASGIVQTVWLRSRVSLRFNIPLDGGKTIGGKRVFGDSKTWRGFVVMVPAVGASFFLLGTLRPFLATDWQHGLWPLSPAAYALLGCWVGLGFMAGELPNSCLKRQLGIAPGETPTPTWARLVCFVLDQVDSIVVGLLALSLVVPTPIGTWVILVVLGAGIHWLFNVVLFLLGVKTRPA